MTKLSITDLFGTKSELVLVLAIIAILLILFVPIPAFFLDFLITLNFSIGLLILLMTFYIDRPVGFSTFPTLLLIATLFRLALNISATRLILSNGDAGNVIDAVGQFVVGGNYIIGLVVFFILIIVQYVVVTNGAQRVAEVAARFTLDSMPGKQMSIDADLNMGIITEQEAQQRRHQLSQEASFYGAMDGASKFVKGDAIAGIIIVLIDILGGLAVGVGQQSLSWSEALHTYTLLTVGDGIVTQIPALILSTATGIIVTRAASDSFLGQEITSQVAKYPKSLSLVVLALIGLFFVNGMPFFPIFLVCAIAAYLLYKALTVDEQTTVDETKAEVNTDQEAQLYSDMTVVPLEIMVGTQLAESYGKDSSLFMEKIQSFRKQYAIECGIVIPKVKVVINPKINDCSYEIKIQGGRVDSSEIYPDRKLAISANTSIELPGIKGHDPSYHLPAVWIAEEHVELARQQQCTIVDATTVLFTHFTEVVRRHSSELITRQETEQLLSVIKQAQPGLYEEVVPNVLTLTDIQKVFGYLAAEGVSIRNVQQIFEALADFGRQTKDILQLAEMTRKPLGRIICEPLLSKESALHVLTLAPGLEQSLHQAIRSSEEGNSIILPPNVLEQLLLKLAKAAEQMMKGGLKPVLLCSSQIRRPVKKLTERMLSQLTVISMVEVPSIVDIRSFQLINIEKASIGLQQEVADG
ncbi:flagellar biosynthesis protein FlhA [Spartinivicinus ruber]|uniref:flagellar biosynthesis protein FlhA n=1 Tax=Spartinivicinus ruber TaxID=2683272 RepID=UPI0013D219F5|nr:flagellar biosynthesis protein FlhA [Spartinivicinus ruber]